MYLMNLHFCIFFLKLRNSSDNIIINNKTMIDHLIYEIRTYLYKLYHYLIQHLDNIQIKIMVK